MSWKETLNKEVLESIRSALEGADRLAIFSHIHPDGDTIGAQLGLARVLKAMGKDVLLYNTMERPQSFAFLEGFDALNVWAGEPLPDLVLTLDCGSLDRLALPEEALLGHRLLSIDHHAGNSLFADWNLVAPDASSTCEMAAALAYDWQWPIDPAAATAFYTGISTDTGSFKYEETSALTMRLAARLLESGADHHAVRYHIYENTSKAKFMLLQDVYAETRFAAEGAIAYTTLRHARLEELGVPDDELHGIASLIKEVEGVEVAVLVRELASGKSKISFRSKASLDCNRIAVTFGGGGHARAAGAVINQPPDEASVLVIQALEEALTV